MARPPSDAAPVLTPGGTFTQAWRAFFTAISGAAGAAQTVTPTGSPFTYTAPAAGALVLNSTVSGLQLIRGRDPVALPAAPGVIPMAAGDQLYVNYGVGAAPSMTFLPS